MTKMDSHIVLLLMASWLLLVGARNPSRKSDPVIIPPHLIRHEDPSMDDVPGDPLGPTDFEAGAKLKKTTFNDTNGKNPLDGNYFEGDIELRREDVILMKTKQTEALNDSINVLPDPYRKWPDGIIPYVVARSFKPNERAEIAKAMDSYHQRTCIRFIPRTDENDFIRIQPGMGCSSEIGRKVGGQPVNLGRDCVVYGLILHELMHAAGFWHEQCRPDRDDYVIINWSNIIEGKEHNFQILELDEMQYLDVDYDLGSIMHYKETTFSVDPQHLKTIYAVNGEKIGNRDDFSEKDLLKLNKLYECNK